MPLFPLIGLVLVLITFHGSVSAATFNVDSTDDFVDKVIGDGVCATEFNTCTLRAAVQEANASNTWPNIISLPAGNYILNYGSANEGASAEGDLDIKKPLEIVGEDPATTIIDGNNSDRIFDIKYGAGYSHSYKDPIEWVKIKNITLQNGSVDLSNGGAILSYENLLIDNVVFKNNSVTNIDQSSSGFRGGAIYTSSRLEVYNSIFSFNSAEGNGGALYSNGMVIIKDSTFDNNTAVSGGAIDGGFRNGTFSNLVISNNIATQDGGGLKAKGTFTDIIVTNNSAKYGGGIYLTESSNVYSSIIYQNNSDEYGGGVY
ncbi:MAG: hypothetical protein R3240_10095, partial [Gammaproteobacteria bacterium]|nr:hypothetical protein [Gammaproteobacteria bacterium]